MHPGERGSSGRGERESTSTMPTDLASATEERPQAPKWRATHTGQGCSWSKLPTNMNLALRYQSRGMLNGERCTYRHPTLAIAKFTCEQEQAWCGGVSRDTGLDCGHGSKLQFELRLNSSLADAGGATSWLYWCGAPTTPMHPPRYKPPPITLPLWSAVKKAAVCIGRCPRYKDLFLAIMTSRRYLHAAIRARTAACGRCVPCNAIP